jgi:Ser/Thr protein kinase RdoA (MazF antagonist)
VNPISDRGTEFVHYLCEHFAVEQGDSPAVVRAGQGSVGVVWRLEVGAARYAVKEFLWGLHESEVDREVAFRDLVAGAGVLSPRNIPAIGGGYLSQLPPELGGRVVRVYEWLDGTPVRAGDPAGSELAGEALGRMHAQKAVPVNGPDSWYFVSPDETVWSTLVSAASKAGAPWAHDLLAAVPDVMDLAELTAQAPCDPLQILHLDMTPSNMLMLGAQLAVLDWDNTDTGSPERELASLLAQWHIVDGVVDRAGAARTLQRYRSAGGDAELHDESSFGMRVATHLNYLRCQAELALDTTADAATRRTAEERTVGALATLPRRPDLRELLKS